MFAIVAALTGRFYVIAPTIDAWKHADVDRVQATGDVRSLDAIVAAANFPAPSGSALRTATLPASATDSVRVTFARSRDASASSGHSGHNAATLGNAFVYVNPHTATVIDPLNEADRFI